MMQVGAKFEASRRVGVVLVSAALVVAGGCSDDAGDGGDASSPETSISVPAQVSDSDEVVTDLPQAASLALVNEEGSWFVQNTGNVTVSEIELRDGDDTLCVVAEVAPSERVTCAEADGLDSVSATGVDPNGETVSAASE